MFQDNEFRDWLETNKLSERTIKEYLYYYRKVEPMFPLTQGKLNAFLRGNNNNVARAFLRNLKEFILEDDNLSDEGKLRASQLRIKKIRGADNAKKEKIVLSPEDIERIVLSIKSEWGKDTIRLLYYCSLRGHELLKIKVKDFNWIDWEIDEKKNGRLMIAGKRGRVRYVLVPPYLMESIRNVIVQENMNLETNFIPINSKVTLWRYLDKISKKALGRHISSHVFRRSFATHLLEGTKNIKLVQEHLGHKDLSTTQHYIQLSKEFYDQEYTKFLNG